LVGFCFLKNACKIVKLLVSEGAFVKAGVAICTLETSGSDATSSSSSSASAAAATSSSSAIAETDKILQFATAQASHTREQAQAEAQLIISQAQAAADRIIAAAQGVLIAPPPGPSFSPSQQVSVSGNGKCLLCGS
jgi:multidrug efflux pump subunit AcrA (membrane-fusion protein)